MRKLFWTFTWTALLFVVAHACGGDDTMPPGTSSGTGAGGAGTGSSSTASTTASTTTGRAGR
jgi:hypothetical protein